MVISVSTGNLLIIIHGRTKKILINFVEIEVVATLPCIHRKAVYLSWFYQWNQEDSGTGDRPGQLQKQPWC